MTRTLANHIVGVTAMILAALIVTACGPITNPSPVSQLASLAVIDAARIGVTAELSPRVEQAYAQGKIPFPVYVAIRNEEQAALDALGGLRTRALTGQTVTQAEIADAETTFIVPLQNLVSKYVPVSIPTTQPAR